MENTRGAPCDGPRDRHRHGDSDQERGKGTRVIYLALIEGPRAFILLCLHILLLTVVKFTNVYVHFIVCCTPCIMSVTFTQ